MKNKDNVFNKEALLKISKNPPFFVTLAVFFGLFMAPSLRAASSLHTKNGRVAENGSSTDESSSSVKQGSDDEEGNKPGKLDSVEIPLDSEFVIEDQSEAEILTFPTYGFILALAAPLTMNGYDKSDFLRGQDLKMHKGATIWPRFRFYPFFEKYGAKLSVLTGLSLTNIRFRYSDEWANQILLTTEASLRLTTERLYSRLTFFTELGLHWAIMDSMETELRGGDGKPRRVRSGDVLKPHSSVGLEVSLADNYFISLAYDYGYQGLPQMFYFSITGLSSL